MPLHPARDSVLNMDLLSSIPCAGLGYFCTFVSGIFKTLPNLVRKSLMDLASWRSMMFGTQNFLLSSLVYLPLKVSSVRPDMEIFCQ